MYTVIPFSTNPDFAFRYKNYRQRNKTPQELNNERYEGYMRSDFSAPRFSYVIEHDGVEVIRIK